MAATCSAIGASYGGASVNTTTSPYVI
ncbi:MAG: hypothetical protein IPH77_06280 [Ignavibacteria bacterium]|nr:hypothetical protein [Ignavibacteria bacterium]